VTSPDRGTLFGAVQVDEFARRTFNVVAAAGGLLVLSPILLLTAIAIRYDSPGPALFRQRRVGRGGREFDILKFRSMRTDAERHGGQLTVGADPRVTRIGKYLRAWKLDELPQLLNVVRGEMDLVGPRPEVPRYVALYSNAQRRVLEARPGITDPASVEFRNESELMATQAEPERYYVETIMPRKLALNLEYLADRTLLSDLKVIFSTLATLATGAKRRG